MRKYRKRPVVIEAVRLTEENGHEVWQWANSKPHYAPDGTMDGLTIFTLEGRMKADFGDWIIKGVEGEFYPCKPDIFDKTYVEVPEDDGRQRHSLTRLVPDHWMSDASTLVLVRESMREDFLAAVRDRTMRLTWTIIVEGEDGR